MKSVLLTGAKGSGKTTVAEVLAEEFGFVHLALADPLRWEVAEMIAAQRYAPGTGHFELLSGELFTLLKEQGPTKDLLRGLCQWYGSEFRRAEDSLYWVKKTQGIIRDRHYQDHILRQESRPIVIDDVSFDNEAAAWSDWPVVRVVRPGADSTDGHASEVGRRSIPAEITIFNEGSLCDLGAVAYSLGCWLTGQRDRIDA